MLFPLKFTDSAASTVRFPPLPVPKVEETIAAPPSTPKLLVVSVKLPADPAPRVAVNNRVLLPLKFTDSVASTVRFPPVRAP